MFFYNDANDGAEVIEAAFMNIIMVSNQYYVYVYINDVNRHDGTIMTDRTFELNLSTLSYLPLPFIRNLLARFVSVS